MERNAQSRDSYPYLVSLSEKYNKIGNKVLDVGIHGDVYPGGHSYLFKEATYETVDIDGGVLPTHHADIRDLPMADETYDLIICHSVIEHVLEDRERAYSELWRVLKAGGTLFYAIPVQMEAREVEPASFVSQTVIKKFYEGKDYDFTALPDNMFIMEIRK